MYTILIQHVAKECDMPWWEDETLAEFMLSMMTTKRREIVEVNRHNADVASFFRLHRMLDQFVILSKSV